MKREQASKEAREIAEREGIVMVVTFNPYGEEELEADRFGYFPAAALRIFHLEEEVERIHPPELEGGS